MKKVFLSILLVVFCSMNSSEEPQKKPKKTCKSTGYSSRDATVLSMMGWGIAIFAGIAALCALSSDNPSDTTTSSSSGT